MIERKTTAIINDKIHLKKMIILTGPRQVGKTTLLKEIIRLHSTEHPLFFNCDEPDIRNVLTDATSSKLINIVGSSSMVVIDEAQRVKNIGLTLKLLYDSLPDVQFLVSGSSSFELANSISEPLTGRKFEYNLFPFSTEELVNRSSEIEEKRLLDNRLIYGMYPDVINNSGQEEEILLNLSDSYLYKDIFAFQGIRKPAIIEKLLQLLALQVGNEVSFFELGQNLGIDTITVQRYIDFLEKAFVVFHLHSYSKNVRNELKKSIKIYFYDNGIRNAIISNFNPIDLRTDKGALWENFMISERLKYNAYNGKSVKSFFWRTTQGQEIDYIEEENGILNAFEFKYNASKLKTKCPVTFSSNYTNSVFNVITIDNYMQFLL